MIERKTNKQRAVLYLSCFLYRVLINRSSKRIFI